CWSASWRCTQGFLEHTDHHVGRLVDAIEALGALDNTLVYYIIGDNGASAEGTVNGAFNEMANFNGLAAIETPEFMAAMKDKLGTVEAYNHYSVGWAWAMCTPYQWTKQVASHWGGTRNGTIVHWPAGFESRGEVRSQFTHVIDVAPTVLEAAGLPEPTFVNGVQQSPIEGTSMLYTFDGADAPERHELQYFEMAGNRGIYFKGWSAVTRHSAPGCRTKSSRRSTTTCGSCTTETPTGPRPTTSPPSGPSGWPGSSASGSSRRSGTTSCPSTTDGSND
ncbi:MAG: sulfatase-like hydrolase/transferase, partial [Dermatophilaceae bacterium]